MRIPLYYYSDYLYIGYAYPWVRPAQDVYGWSIYAYDGANATYKTQLGNSDWEMTAQTWYGGFKQKDNAYDTLFIYTTPTDEAWRKILGGYIALNNGIFDLRAMLMKHRATITLRNPDGTTETVLDNQFTRNQGLSINMDYKNWVVRSEIGQVEQVSLPEVNSVFKTLLFSVGHVFDTLTPMYTFSRYRSNVDPIEGRNTQSISLRWDFMKNTALKMQYDISKDMSTFPYKYIGDSKVVSISLQGIF